MARVQTHAHAAMAVHPVDDRRQLLEGRGKRGALPCRVLENDHGLPAPAFPKEPGERFGDEREPVGRTAVGVAAWMQHDAEQPQCFSAIELIRHRVDGLPAESGIRRGEVDEVAGVRHHGSETRRFDLARGIARFLRAAASVPATGWRFSRRSGTPRSRASPRDPPRAAVRRRPTCERPGVGSSRPLTIAFVVLHRGALPLLLILTGVAGHAEDWPEFRGPTGQGHSSERGLPLEWSESRNVVWKTAVPGRGWSSPVVAAGRVWLTTATDKGASLRALAFDVETGRELVNTEVVRIRGGELLNPKNSRASPTPIVEGDRVYVHFGADGTAALTTSGEVVWKVQLRYESQHGNGGSPVLYGDLLILSCDGSDDGVRRGARQADGEGRLEDAAASTCRSGVFHPAGDQSRRPRRGGERWSVPRGRVRSAHGPGNLVGRLPRTVSPTCRVPCTATDLSTSRPVFNSRPCWRCAQMDGLASPGRSRDRRR